MVAMLTIVQNGLEEKDLQVCVVLLFMVAMLTIVQNGLEEQRMKKVLSSLLKVAMLTIVQNGLEALTYTHLPHPTFPSQCQGKRILKIEFID
jgi:hypothetical protein